MTQPESPPDINEDVTRKVANLARLELTEAEVQAFTLQIKKVLEHVGVIDGLSTENVEPLYHPIEMETALREDHVRPFKTGKILESAPDALYNGYKVPSIL